MTGHPGTLVPDRFVGTVVGRHAAVHNVEVRQRPAGSGHEQRVFISLVTNPGDQTAFSIRIGPDNRHLLGAIPEGSEISGDPGGLWMRGHNQIDNRRILQYDDVIPRYQGSLNLTPSQVHRIVAGPAEEIRAVLLNHPDYRYRGLVPLLDLPRETEDPFAARARRLCATGDYGRLVGLGPGFTPAGDDFLTGLLLRTDLEDHCGALPPRKRARFDLLRAEIRETLHRTTTGGATLLRLALENRPPVYIHRICVILGDSESPIRLSVERAVAVAAAHGFSSGLDFLTGFLWDWAEQDDSAR